MAEMGVGGGDVISGEKRRLPRERRAQQRQVWAAASALPGPGKAGWHGALALCPGQF